MGIVKKIRSMLCAALAVVVFASGGVIPVFADNLVFDMEALGIADGVENIPDRLNETVRRGEFCQFVVNMMGYQSVADAAEYTDAFEDIADSIHKNAIRLMYSLNLISGDDGQTFSPNRAITIKEAAKILVDALGYSPIVTDRTLDSYYIAASSLGLLRSVNADGAGLDFQSALVMIDNALDIDRMVYSHIGSGDISYKKDSGNTYRELLLYSAKYDIVKMSGVVTADVSTYLNTKITSLDANQLEIEGKTYTFDAKAPLGLVGRRVEYYVKVTDGDERVFKIAVAAKNRFYNFDSEDLVSVSQHTLRFEDGSISIAPNAKYVYNNRLKRDFSINDFSSLENFKALAIDSDGDSVYETIFVEEYINCIVERVYENDFLVYLKDSTPFRGMRYIDLDMDDKDFYVELRGEAGEEITFEDIKTDMVLSVAASEDGEALKVYACDKTVEGILSSYSDTHITIDGEQYRHNIDETDLTVGAQARAYINFDGNVVFIDSPSDSLNYAYVYALASKGGLSGMQAKLLIPGPVSVKYTETEDEDGGAATKTPKLFCRNSDILVLEFAEKVSVNGTRLSSDNFADYILNKPISYQLNDDGKIRVIDVLKPADATNSKYYNANELTFGKTGDLAFGIAQDRTRSICLPTNASASDSDLKEFVELLNGVQYNVEGYALNDSTHIVDILVIHSEMRSGVAGITNSSSDVAMVDSVKTVSAEDGETRIVVSMIFDKELKDYTVSNLIQDAENFQKLTCGDLIAFSLDAFDNLNAYEVIQGADNYYDFILGEYTENERFCGIVTDIDYNTISNRKNRWIHAIDVGFEDGSAKTVYEALARGSMPIFVIENRRRVRAGTIDDVRPGGRVFVLSNTDVPRAVVVDNRD
jgi:hypothetical protein